MIQRQGLITTVKELKQLAEQFDKQQKELCEELSIEWVEDLSFIINIVNKTKSSEGWEIENE